MAVIAVAEEVPVRQDTLVGIDYQGLTGAANVILTRQVGFSSLKAWGLRIAKSAGFKKAEVTAGGVSLREVDSSTMESKLVPNLFLAGEVLDLDGPIGGFNFQAAFSTAWLAGSHV